MSLVEQGYKARAVCTLLDFPRSNLYRETTLIEESDELRTALVRLAGEWPTYGYRRLTAMLRREGHAANSKRVPLLP